ncbi:MAG: iron-containing alcohol dehydrogenase [Lachnospiraceae bacterium]|nr:iron-containing alcohol dehydrogenase [Lachnospiraceae bacterium]
MKAVIFNSGLGSRMGDMTKDKPKCLVELYNGETILERQLRILGECGIHEFVITTGPHKEKIIAAAENYPELEFAFVDNPDYLSTNYIVSMHNASEYLDDDVLLLHGDLVFNRRLIEKILADKRKSLCLYNEEKELPEKDFKGQFSNNILKKVSVNVFGDDCYAFQPLYKLSKENIAAWKREVAEWVAVGKTRVYAEEAFNNIAKDICIRGLSYKDDYIEEIDNLQDYKRVSEEIRFWDYREQKTEITDNYINSLKKYILRKDKIFAVCTRSQAEYFVDSMHGYDVEVFSSFSPNPSYEEVVNGTELFKRGNYKKLISVGGGSAMDVAKCIKLHASVSEKDFTERKYKYHCIRHIAIPTTAGTGSESTEIAVIYCNGKKLSVEHGSALPDVAILDANLLKTLPDYQKKITMLDAFCQGIESYWAKGANGESREYAIQCIRLIMENCEAYLKGEEGAACKIMSAAHYSGKAINISRTTAAHAMSYKLTGIYGLGHGYAVALCILPIWKLLWKKAEADEQLHSVLSGLAKEMGFHTIEESISETEKMMQGLHLPPVKIREEDVPMLAQSVELGRMSNNPVMFTFEEIAELYQKLC